MRPDFQRFCESESLGFCETYEETCGEWTAETPCVTHYTTAPRGDDNPRAGATQACYEYYLGMAMTYARRGEALAGEVTFNCARAAGAEPCTQ